MAPRYCDHDFKEGISDIDAAEHAYIIAICVYCGQVRHLYSDGRVVIAIETGEVTKKSHGPTNNT